MFDDVIRTSTPGADHRDSSGYGFDDRQAESLFVRRADNNVERGQHRRHIADVAGKDHPVTESEGAGKCGDLLAELVPCRETPFSEENEVDAEPADDELGQHAYGHILALPRLDSVDPVVGVRDPSPHRV